MDTVFTCLIMYGLNDNKHENDINEALNSAYVIQNELTKIDVICC